MTTADDASIPTSKAESILNGRTGVGEVMLLEPDDLDGYSIDDLSDYLDSGMTPRDPVIEISPSCQIALAALARLKAATGTLLDDEALSEEPPSAEWMASILENISLESRAGRKIPFQHTHTDAELAITEGAVRGIIRTAGDSVPGIVIGRSVLHGDVTLLGEPITIDVNASVIWDHNIPDAAAQLRDAVELSIARNTDLTIARIDVTISDVHLLESEDEA